MEFFDVIREHLGGNQFSSMVNAENWTSDEKEQTLTFRFPRSNGVNLCRIKLNKLDLYNIEFGSAKGQKVKTKQTYEDVYADNLRKIFERGTGLKTNSK